MGNDYGATRIWDDEMGKKHRMNAELDFMERAPRDTHDRLVNHMLIFLAYGIVDIT